MRAVDLIQKKKDGFEHTKEEIDFLINNYLNGKIEDYQMSAWLMAVCFQGLTDKETAYLTQSFVNSGEILDFSSINQNIADKQSFFSSVQLRADLSKEDRHSAKVF